MQTLRQRRGICGDYANLTLALLRAAKMPARLVYGTADAGPGRVEHAWVETLVDGAWVVIDPTWGLFDPDPVAFAQTHSRSGYGE